MRWVVTVRMPRPRFDTARPVYLLCRNMEATIQKWGNSLAVRIPQAVARQIGIGEGDGVRLEVDANALVMRPSKPKYRIGELVRKMRPGNRHDEIDWGEPQGREV